MFRKWYKVEIIVTPKNGPRYSIFRKQKMNKKEMIKLVNTRKCGLADYTKPYAWIAYNATKI